jgi:hypothetical protein
VECLDAMGRAAAAAGDHAAAAVSLERSLELHERVGGMASRAGAYTRPHLCSSKHFLWDMSGGFMDFQRQ